MKNKNVILLGLVILLLSFFVFEGQNQITGLPVIDGKFVSFFIEEQPPYPQHPRITTIYADQTTIKRGGRAYLTVVPGPLGVYSRAELVDRNNQILASYNICPGTLCREKSMMPVYISRSAVLPGTHSLRLKDIQHGFVEQPLTII